MTRGPQVVSDFRTRRTQLNLIEFRSNCTNFSLVAKCKGRHYHVYDIHPFLWVGVQAKVFFFKGKIHKVSLML